MLDKDPRARSSSEERKGEWPGAGAKATLSGRQEPGCPQRNQRIPVLQTTSEQKASDSGLGRGRGAREPQPALCWPGREVHSTQSHRQRLSPPLKGPKLKWRWEFPSEALNILLPGEGRPSHPESLNATCLYSQLLLQIKRNWKQKTKSNKYYFQQRLQQRGDFRKRKG